MPSWFMPFLLGVLSGMFLFPALGSLVRGFAR